MSSDSAATGRITLPAALRQSVAAAGAAALSVTQHGSTVSLRPASVHGPSVPERLRRPRRSGSAPAAGSLSPRPSRQLGMVAGDTWPPSRTGRDLNDKALGWGGHGATWSLSNFSVMGSGGWDYVPRTRRTRRFTSTGALSRGPMVSAMKWVSSQRCHRRQTTRNSVSSARFQRMLYAVGRTVVETRLRKQLDEKRP